MPGRACARVFPPKKSGSGCRPRVKRALITAHLHQGVEQRHVRQKLAGGISAAEGGETWGSIASVCVCHTYLVIEDRGMCCASPLSPVFTSRPVVPRYACTHQPSCDTASCLSFSIATARPHLQPLFSPDTVIHPQRTKRTQSCKCFVLPKPPS